MILRLRLRLFPTLTGLVLLPLILLLTACGTSNDAAGPTAPVALRSPSLLPVAAIGHTSQLSPATGTSIPSAAAGTATPTPVATVTVYATDFAFQLDRSSVPAGLVHFVLINKSSYFPHEVMVYPQDQPKLPALLAALAAGEQVNHDDYLQGVVGSAEDVQPGQTASSDAILQPGTYELGCFITSTIGPGQMMGSYFGAGNGYPMGPGMMGGYSGYVGYGMGMQVNHYLAGLHTLLTVTAP